MKIFCTDYPALYPAATLSPQEVDLRAVYSKPDSAYLNSGKALYLPSHIRTMGVMPHLVVRIERVGRSVQPAFVQRYWSQVALALSFAGVDEVRRAIAQGLPHCPFSGFDGALSVGLSHPYVELCQRQIALRLSVTRTLPLTLPTPAHIESYLMLLSRYYMLKIGDLITFPLHSQYERVVPHDHLLLLADEQEQVYVPIA